MTSFDVLFLYTNIPIIDTINIIKDFINNDDQGTRKTAVPRGKLLDLVGLVLTTTWYTFKYQFYQQTGGVTIGGPPSSTTVEIICRLMNKLQYLRHYTLQMFGNYLLITFIPFLNVCTWKTFFHHINNLH